ncbi:MAG: response regulator [Hyphomonadaceae bacterium]|nr:response regulator [Hyphomonadaceae bacterium]
MRHPPEAPDTIGGKLAVLAVDDDALVLMSTVAMLEDLGCHVVSANSGEAALQLLATERVDLVVSDQSMPRMTGLQLADAIRARRPDMPVIIATGYAELPPEAAKDLVRLGKPFMLEDLARALAAISARSSASGQSGR